MRARRTFDEKFKRQIVESVLSGSFSQVELSRKYTISPLLISRWKKEYKQGKFFENNMDITRFELKLHEFERVVGELTMENRMLRQVIDLVEKKKRRVLDCNLPRLQNVKRGCEIMQTPRSSFYYKPNKSSAYESDLADKINEIALEFPSYGYRRVTAALRREDMIVNHKKVYRIMESENILCKIRRSFKKTTNSSHGLLRYPNLIKGIIPLRVNEIWHADITYIRLRTSFTYLAALIDGLSRKVVGYALGRTLCAELTVQALLDALSNRNIICELTHHSDQGVQYCCQEYINILMESNIKISMSERANPYDNAKI